MTRGAIVTRRNFSFVARSSLFVVKSLVTHCKIRSLLVAKFTRYSLQKLLVAKITRYSLQNSLVTRSRSCSLQKITRYSLLVAEVASLFVTLWKRNSTTVLSCEFLRNFKDTYSVENQRTAASELFTVFYVRFFTLIWFKFDWIVTELLVKLN